MRDVPCALEEGGVGRDEGGGIVGSGCVVVDVIVIFAFVGGGGRRRRSRGGGAGRGRSDGESGRQRPCSFVTGHELGR